MQRIGLLIPSLNSGGAERVVSRLSFALSQEYEIYLIAYDASNAAYQHSGVLLDMAIPAHSNIFVKLTLPIRRTLALRKFKLEHKLEVVISFLDSPNLVNILSKVAGCKTIISVRSYESTENDLLKLVGRLFYCYADCVVSVSQIMRDKLCTFLHLPPEKIVTIYNPINIPDIEQQAKEPIESEYVDFFNTGLVFISVGRQVYQKGYWHLIKAFKLVTKFNPDAKLIIIGRDEINGKCQQLVNKLGLSKSCLIIGFHPNPFKFMARSAVYVLSSLYEGFPNAMVEAMASGCAVIAADCMTGPREILACNWSKNVETARSLQMEKYGILVPPLERDEDWSGEHNTMGESILAAAMMRLADSANLLSSYRSLARDRAAHFSVSQCVERYNRVIRGITLNGEKDSVGNC